MRCIQQVPTEVPREGAYPNSFIIWFASAGLPTPLPGYWIEAHTSILIIQLNVSNHSKQFWEVPWGTGGLGWGGEMWENSLMIGILIHQREQKVEPQAKNCISDNKLSRKQKNLSQGLVLEALDPILNALITKDFPAWPKNLAQVHP